MPRQVFQVLVAIGLIALFSVALFGGYLTTCQFEWLRLVAVEIQAACRDAGTQWMVVVCLLSYFVTFLILERRLAQSRDRSPDVWLFGFVALVLLRYAVDYTDAAKSSQVVVLLVGIVVGKGVALWAGWGHSKFRHFTPSLFPVEAERMEKHPTSNAQPPELKEDLAPASIKRTQVVLCGLVLLLAATALWQPEMGMDFYYRGVRRWEGVWDNPNIYGLLMGVGAILAMGLLAQIGRSEFNTKAQRQATKLSVETSYQPSTLNYLLSVLLLAAVGVCAFGLLKSYSRGAWLATACALAWLIGLIGNWVWRFGSGNTRLLWFRRNWFPISTLLVSVFVLCFWQFRHTESPLFRRVFSVGNVNDFSWRNRVTAWQGAGHMMLEKPLAGFGWGKAEEAYRKGYRAARLEETAAIQLNDYLMLGTSAGVPALICLVIYFSLVGYQVLRIALGRFNEPSTLNFQLSTAAMAAAFVLLIGFWFDGGLFKLPTCVAFWILLELVRSGTRGDKAQINWDKKEESRLDKQEGLTAKHTKTETALRWLAGMVAIFAIGQTALHLCLPRFAISPRTLAMARHWLVPMRETADFEFLASKRIWSGRPLNVLMQQAHLANYNRELVNWKIEDTMYQSFVLSSEIDPAFDGDMNWRRPLWEYFYPRIRKESSMEAAVETMIRELRHRVEIVAAEDFPKSIKEMWEHGKANTPGFEALFVAVLRSAGIPSRLSVLGQAEFWNGAEWKIANL